MQICQSNYTKDLLEWIEPDNLPDWLGGRSKGTLLDDVGPWSDPEVLRRMEGQLSVAAKALKRMSTLPPGPVDGQLVVMDNELADGYHSPRCARPARGFSSCRRGFHSVCFVLVLSWC